MATPYGDVGMADVLEPTAADTPAAPPPGIPEAHKTAASEYDSALSKRGGKGEKIMPVEELDKWAAKIGLQSYDDWRAANPRLSEYGSTPRLHYAAYVDQAMHDIEVGKTASESSDGYGDINMDETASEPQPVVGGI